MQEFVAIPTFVETEHKSAHRVERKGKETHNR